MNTGQQNQSLDNSSPKLSMGTASGDNLMSADKGMEHLWRYFALHAQQRLSVFNFFVVLSGVILAAIGGSLQAGRPQYFVVIVLGLFLPLLSFVFWRLDQRNSDLIKIAERALRRGEEACLPDYARIFVRESLAGTSTATTEDRVSQTTWTFRTSFRLIFIVMATSGAFASGFGAYRWLYEPVAKVEQPNKAKAPFKANLPSTPPKEPLHDIEPIPSKEPVETKTRATKPEQAIEKSAAPKN